MAQQLHVQISGTHSELSSLLKGQSLSLRLSKSTLREEPIIAVEAVIDGRPFPLTSIKPSAILSLLEQE